MSKLINIFLIGITFLSIYAIAYIGLGWFWAWGTSGNYQRVNQVIINLSYSYLAGLIFYLLTSYFPYMIKRNKLKKPIIEKLRTIERKLEDSAKCVFPMPSWNHVDLTEDALVQQFSKLSINDPSAYSAVGMNMSIIDHLTSQRNNIIDIINGVLEYKDYLSEEQLLAIEKIKDSNYFSVLKVFSIPMMDTPTAREQLAKTLFEEIQASKKLLEYFD